MKPCFEQETGLAYPWIVFMFPGNLDAIQP